MRLRVVFLTSVVGAPALVAAHSLSGILVFAGLLTGGGALVRLSPEREGNASRRGRRLLAGPNAQGARPAIVPGPVLHDAQHRAFTLMAPHRTPATGAFRSGGGFADTSTAEDPTVNEGPGWEGCEERDSGASAPRAALPRQARGTRRAPARTRTPRSPRRLRGRGTGPQAEPPPVADRPPRVRAAAPEPRKAPTCVPGGRYVRTSAYAAPLLADSAVPQHRPGASIRQPYPIG
ncbi:hypothetical protein GCM10018987_05350 [Streptomyces cremeus]